MRLRIDDDRCEGHGRCWDLAPDLFDADEVGHGIVRTTAVPGDQVLTARAAANACPERAVILED